MSTVKSIRLPLSFAENAFGYSDSALFSGGTNVFKEVIHYFPIGGNGKLHGSIVVPESYDNTVDPKVRVLIAFLAARAPSDQVRFEFALSAFGDADLADPAAVVETLAATLAVPSLAAKTAKLFEFSPTKTNLVAGKLLRYHLTRVKNHADDNVSATVMLWGPWLKASFT